MPREQPKALSDQIRDAIKRSGKSLYAIAKEADLDYLRVWTFVRRKSDPKASTLDAIARALKLELKVPEEE